MLAKVKRVAGCEVRLLTRFSYYSHKSIQPIQNWPPLIHARRTYENYPCNVVTAQPMLPLPVRDRMVESATAQGCRD
jgi:hypothetical protein